MRGWLTGAQLATGYLKRSRISQALGDTFKTQRSTKISGLGSTASHAVKWWEEEETLRVGFRLLKSPPKLLLASGKRGGNVDLELPRLFSPRTLYTELPEVLPPAAAGGQDLIL